MVFLRCNQHQCFYVIIVIIIVDIVFKNISPFLIDQFQLALTKLGRRLPEKEKAGQRKAWYLSCSGRGAEDGGRLEAESFVI